MSLNFLHDIPGTAVLLGPPALSQQIIQHAVKFYSVHKVVEFDILLKNVNYDEFHQNVDLGGKGLRAPTKT